jgi:hypothetical protein
VLSFRSASNLIKYSSKTLHLMHFIHKNFAWNLLQYLQITITPCDTSNLIRLLNVYTKTENWQIKNELDVNRMRYIYILQVFAFMILNNFLLTEDSISGLLNNMNRKNTKLGMKGTQFLTSLEWQLTLIFGSFCYVRMSCRIVYHFSELPNWKAYHCPPLGIELGTLCHRASTN